LRAYIAETSRGPVRGRTVPDARRAALRAEAKAIKNELPLFNIREASNLAPRAFEEP
jgi:hypothetical protein